MKDTQLYIRTPLQESHHMSKLSGFVVHLKLENLQPSSSFKLRGISNLCCKAVSAGATNFVTSSGGNAGLAVAYSGRKLSVPVTVVVPQTTPEFMVQRLREETATVIVHGAAWDDANTYALELCKKPGFVYVPPFNHPDVWEGHESMIVESSEQLDAKPDVVIVSVGGGGLMIGVLQGMHKVGWTDVPVVAMETKGADSFNVSVIAGKIVTLDAITSVAICLGARRIADNAFDWIKKHNIISCVVDDREAVGACETFADDHKMLVEPSCGAALAAVYSGVINQLVKEGKLKEVKNALVIVCGGYMVTMQQIRNWKQKLGMES